MSSRYGLNSTSQADIRSTNTRFPLPAIYSLAVLQLPKVISNLSSRAIRRALSFTYHNPTIEYSFHPNAMASNTQPGSLFGNSNSGVPPATTQQTAGGFSLNNSVSGFGSSMNMATGQALPAFPIPASNSQQQPPPQQPQGLGNTQQQTYPTPTTQPAFFNSLIERGKKRPLTGQNDAATELPSLQLGLGDIRRKARELGTGGPKTPQRMAADNKA